MPHNILLFIDGHDLYKETKFLFIIKSWQHINKMFTIDKGFQTRRLFGFKFFSLGSYDYLLDQLLWRQVCRFIIGYGDISGDLDL